MATYKQIQQWVEENYGFSVKTCWIADMKNKYGLTTRQASNRLDEKKRVHPCPESKKESLEAALKYFGMI